MTKDEIKADLLAKVARIQAGMQLHDYVHECVAIMADAVAEALATKDECKFSVMIDGVASYCNVHHSLNCTQSTTKG